MIVKKIIAYAIFIFGLILIFSGYSAFTIDHKTTIAGWVFITDIIGMILMEFILHLFLIYLYINISKLDCQGFFQYF